MNTQQKIQLPSECDRAREAFGLALADGLTAPAEAAAHATGCAACAKAFVKMERIWGVAGDALPRLRPVPAARLEEIPARALSAAKPAPIMPTVAKIVPLRRERAPRREIAPFAAALALAAMVALVAILGPAMVTPPVVNPDAIAVRPTPVIPAKPPRVTLAAAKGSVSLVPADGSVVKSPVAGDSLPAGLFSASNGAALSIEGAGLLAVRGDTTVLIGGATGAPDLAVARGEIFVDLPKGTIHTFVVHTPTGTVNVTGTQFNVKVAPAETQVEVTRGTVIVRGPHGEQAVGAGEAAKLISKDAPVIIRASDPASDPLEWVRDLAPDRVPPPPVVAIQTRPKHAATNGGTPSNEVAVLPGLDKKVVEMSMEKREAAMRHCYEMELPRDPSLVVRAALRFKVDEDGRPKELRVEGIESRPALGACLIQAAGAAVFPATAPGTEIEVSYPIRFEPAPDR